MDKGKKRPIAHITGDSGVRILESYFPKSWVPREYTHDYGIDLSVEIFNECDGGSITSGEHIFFQVKGTDKLEKISKDSKIGSEKHEVIPFSLDTDLLFTFEKMGSAIPVILAIVDISSKDAFFVCLNDYIEKIIIPQNKNYMNQESKTIYIPINNKINSEDGIHIIKWYAKRPKLYSLFNKINCKRRDLQYCCQDEFDENLTRFLKIILRSDAWSAENYFGVMSALKENLDYYVKHGITEDADKLINTAIRDGKDVDEEIYTSSYCCDLVSLREARRVQSIHSLWDDLCVMGDIFEDNARKAFLPTDLEI